MLNKNDYNFKLFKKSFYVKHNFNTDNLTVLINKLFKICNEKLQIDKINRVIYNDKIKFYILDKNTIFVKANKIANYKIQIIKDFFEKPNNIQYSSKIQLDENYYSSLSGTILEKPLIIDYSGASIYSFFLLYNFYLKYYHNNEMKFKNILSYIDYNLYKIQKDAINIDFADDEIYSALMNSFQEKTTDTSNLSAKLKKFIDSLSHILNVNTLQNQQINLTEVMNFIIGIFLPFIIPFQIIEISNLVLKNTGNDIGFIDMNSYKILAKRKINNEEKLYNLNLIYDFNDNISLNEKYAKYFIFNDHNTILNFLKNFNYINSYNLLQSFKIFKSLTNVENINSSSTIYENFREFMLIDYRSIIGFINGIYAINSAIYNILVKFYSILSKRGLFYIPVNDKKNLEGLFFKNWEDNLFEQEINNYNQEFSYNINPILNSNFKEISFFEIINELKNKKFYNNIFSIIINNEYLYNNIKFYLDDNVKLSFNDINGNQFTIPVNYILVSMTPISFDNSSNNNPYTGY